MTVGGDMSYALYVIHVPVLMVMEKLGARHWLIALTAITLAAVTHYAIEAPATKRLRQLLNEGGRHGEPVKPAL
jgi:peptidoglycan/LPS O-acetylase OafA/YrhL